MISASTQRSPSNGVTASTPRGGLVALLGAALPVLIIGGLLYAAFFIKPSAQVTSVQPATIERRDIFYGVTMPTQDVVWAAGQHGKIVRSTDRGLTWTRQATGTDAHLQAIAVWDGERAVAVGNELTILTTGDGGKTWRKAAAPEGVAVAKLLRVRSYDAGIAWAVGELGTVLSSSDHGASWRSMSTKDDATWNDIAFVGRHGWMVGEFGRIRMTTDGGANWTSVTGPVKSSLNAVAFRDERHGVAVGTGGAVLTTTDGGQTWKALPTITEQHIFDALWDGSRWLIAGDKGLLLAANAEAQSWTDVSGSGQSSWHTQIDGRDGRYALGGYGITVVDIAKAKPGTGANK
jgi:photosystem II stability/assembly factor-like uncharacterized protein